jgi:hypothetical protein
VFRSVSGLILALFAASVGAGVITTMSAHNGGDRASAPDRATLIDQLADYSTSPPTTPVETLPATLIAQLRAVPGVQAITVIHAEQHGDTSTTVTETGSANGNLGPSPGVVSCADLARTVALGRCGAGAQTASINTTIIGTKFAPSILPAAGIAPQQLQGLPVQMVAVGTDGSTAAIERARTVLELVYPLRSSPLTISEHQANSANAKLNAGYRRLADVIVLAGLVVAGCTLAVSLVSGLNDRRRPFSVLRLAGAPFGLLRRIVIVESAMPLLLGAAASMGVGFLAAYLFVRGQLTESFAFPGAEYFLVVLAGLFAAIAIIASTLPILQRITGPGTVRNE